jgi:hypothetical protein
MRNLGYENHSCLSNLGSLAIVTMFYFVKLILFATVLQVFVKFGKLVKLNEYLKKHLLFNELILISLGSYFELLISGYLNYLEPLYTYSGDIISVYLSYYCLVMTIILLPLSFIYLLTREVQNINNPYFLNSYGGLCEGVSIRDKWSLSYIPIYCLRRFIFCLIAFGLEKYPIFQINFCNNNSFF